MKRLKKLLLAVVLLPALLLLGCVAWEVYGMCANYIATARQTQQLQAELARCIDDFGLIEVYSETGNLSGTGNHVECASKITFSTGLIEDEIADAMAEYCAARHAGWGIGQTEDGAWWFSMDTAAPFPDNIEGH